MRTRKGGPPCTPWYPTPEFGLHGRARACMRGVYIGVHRGTGVQLLRNPDGDGRKTWTPPGPLLPPGHLGRGTNHGEPTS